jgi:malonyl-CoA O-methyltransferase
MTALTARDAYRLWAPSYAAETAISFLDDRLANQMLEGLPRKHLLDAGCGTGRRIAGMAGAVGVDASPEMIARGDHSLIVADVRALPFAAGRFDMVWCRLVLGHLRDPVIAYGELARVCAPGGHVFVTDFHADAAGSGGRRSFRDASGAVHAVEHYIHAAHPALAAMAGLSLVDARDGGVGPDIRDFYVHANRLAHYERDLGSRLVSAFLFRKPE